MRLLIRLSLCLFLGVVGPAVALAQTGGPEVRVRFGEHAEYDRLVFDWPDKPKYQVVTRPSSVVIFFDRAATFDFSRFQADPPATLKDIDAAPSESGVAVRLIVPPGIRVKHFPLDNKVVVDLYRPAPGQTTQSQAAAPPAEPVQQPKPPAAEPAQQAAPSQPAPKQATEAPARAPEPESPRPIAGDRDPSISIGPNISTLGIGLEAGYRINDLLGVRVGGNTFSLGYDFEADDVEYDGDINWGSVGAVLDLYPLGGGFRVSGGLRYNANSFDVEAKPNNNVEIGGQTFTPAEIGTLEGSIEFWPVAPYLGLGYEAHFFGGRFGLAFDAGLLFQGKPDAKLDADGTLGSNSTLKRRLREEEEEIEKEVDFLGFYPVIGLSGVLRF